MAHGVSTIPVKEYTSQVFSHAHVLMHACGVVKSPPRIWGKARGAAV